MDLTHIILQYYSWLSGLAATLMPAVDGLATTINFPLVSTLLFGVMGALAPCQISSSVAALAFVSSDTDRSARMWSRMLAFIGGKVTIYMVVGGVIVLAGLRIDEISSTAIPVAVFARRAIGPALILLGLIMTSLFHPGFSVGARISSWLETKAGDAKGMVPSFLLGAAFAFAFCPTLFLLFFGMTVPLAISSPGGIVFPGVFAFGTVLPLVCVAALLVTTRASTARIANHIRRTNRWAQRFAGIILMIVGLHESVLYWLL